MLRKLDEEQLEVELNVFNNLVVKLRQQRGEYHWNRENRAYEHKSTKNLAYYRGIARLREMPKKKGSIKRQSIALCEAELWEISVKNEV